MIIVHFYYNNVNDYSFWRGPVASGVQRPPYCRAAPYCCRRTATILLPPPYCRHTAIADTAVSHVLRLAPPRAIQSSCIHTPYELAGRHRAQGVLLVCFAAGTAAGASVASASIEGIVENVVQVQCTVRFMQYVPKPSLKIGSVNKAFLFWYWQRPKKFFFRNIFFCLSR